MRTELRVTIKADEGETTVTFAPGHWETYKRSKDRLAVYDANGTELLHVPAERLLRITRAVIDVDEDTDVKDAP